MPEPQRKEKIRNNNNVVEIGDYWGSKLARTEKGSVAKTIDNFCIILENAYKGKILLNELSGMVENENKKTFETVDYDKFQMEIEKKFGIYDVKKLNSAIRIVAEKNTYHPVKEILENSKWDGISRVKTILTDYLGAKEEDAEYNAMALRLFLFGAIERVMNPGTKYDYVLIINGTQGIGKSSFFKAMCNNDTNIYQENLKNFEKAFEYTNGKWIVEIAELNSLKKADMDFLKGYITDTSDTYRIPYEQSSKTYQRQFVLYGTTNESNFIPDDPSGERRWIVIEAADKEHKKNIKKSIFTKEGQYEIQQVLAEVYQEYKEGKAYLTVPKEFEDEVAVRSKEYKQDDGLPGMIEGYLKNKFECCTLEIYQEKLQNLNGLRWSKKLSGKIQDIIVNIPGWRKYQGSKDHRKTFANYGKQIAFERYYTDEEKEVARLAQERATKDYRREEENDNINKILGTENEDYFMEVGKNERKN